MVFPLCNEKPERAPYICGHVFFLCWRCSGIVVGVIVSLVCLKTALLSLSPCLFVISIAVLLPMVCDGIMQYGYSRESNNRRRFFTGMLFGFGLVGAIGCIMNYAETLEDHGTLISSAISIVGFIMTFFGVRMELHKSLKEKLVDQQRKIYTDCYGRISALKKNPHLVFERSFLDAVDECAGELNLAGSKEVLSAFSALEEFVQDKWEGYKHFVDENDPHANPNNYEMITQDYEEVEVYHGNEQDDRIYEIRLEKYLHKQIPSKEDISEMLLHILNAMRADIGNSSLGHKL